MKIIRKFFLAICVFLIVIVLGGLHNILSNDRKRENEAFIEISGHRFSIEIADNAVSQARGLSGRERLDMDHGMLFVFPDESVRSFWMVGMNFPLDLIWIKNREIVGITRNLPPATAENMQITNSPGAVDMVLEINAGLADRLGIQPGDLVKY